MYGRIVTEITAGGLMVGAPISLVLGLIDYIGMIRDPIWYTQFHSSKRF